MTTGCCVREAVPQDVTAITSLLGELGYPSSPEQVSARLRKIEQNENYMAFVAEIEGETVGFVGLCKMLAYEADGCYVRILALVVREGYRNRSIGTKLVQAAEKWAVQKGACGMAVDSGTHRKEAHAFYLRRGYQNKDCGFSKSINI